MLSETKNLIDFWRRYEISDDVKMHHDDKVCLKEASSKISRKTQFDIQKYKRVIGQNDFQYLSTDGLKLEVPATPLLGNLANAKVVICMLNPGVGMSDLNSYKCDKFRSCMEKNRRQEFENVEYPFPYLDPEFSWTGGFDWWYRKFKFLIGNDLDVLKRYSQNIAAVELFAYPSKSFNSDKIMNELKSTKLVQKWFKAELSFGKKLLIVGRRPREWGVSENLVQHGGVKNNLAVLTIGERRGASFARKFKDNIEEFMNE